MADCARVVFMGTPQFAVPTLQTLCAADDFSVELVVTRPDRVRGRGRQVSASPIKQLALQHERTVAQPERASDPDLLQNLQQIAPDLIVVVAYGDKIPPSILALPRLAIVNLHASLLPAYRGAAPIQYALLDGLAETGNTVQHMAEGWDEGDIILQETEPVHPDDNTDTLGARLADHGATLMLTALRRLVDGTAPRIPQDHDRASYAPRIKPEDCTLAFHETATNLHNKVRALATRPGAHTTFRGHNLRILQTRPHPGDNGGEPGTLTLTRKQLFVHTGEGRLELLRVQPEGKAVMDALSFKNGHQPAAGERLG